MSSEEALRRLQEGNQRYVAEAMSHPNQSARRRTVLTDGQHPFAVVLGCADSRVSPEILFDQGMGDLFVVRVAGNTAQSGGVLGSIEYAVECLETPLVVVLGHEKCGAVAATVEAMTTSSEVPGHIGSVVDAIRPAVEQVRGEGGDIVENAVRANVARVVEQLRTSGPILSARVDAGKTTIMGAYYSLESGIVTFTV